jgi:hypothetical protein
MQQYARTGHLWEKYNVVDGSLVLPNARCGNICARMDSRGRGIAGTKSLQTGVARACRMTPCDCATMLKGEEARPPPEDHAA